MPAIQYSAPTAAPALVTRATRASDAHDQYLLLTPLGQAQWVDNPEVATPFSSMREATRMAMRLPAALPAFCLPREPELSLRYAH